MSCNADNPPKSKQCRGGRLAKVKEHCHTSPLIVLWFVALLIALIMKLFSFYSSLHAAKPNNDHRIPLKGVTT